MEELGADRLSVSALCTAQLLIYYAARAAGPGGGQEVEQSAASEVIIRTRRSVNPTRERTAALYKDLLFPRSRRLPSPAASLPISYKYIAWELHVFNNSADARAASAQGESGGGF